MSLMGKYLYLVGDTNAYADGTGHSYQDALIIKMDHTGKYLWGVAEGTVWREIYLWVAAAEDDSYAVACGYTSLNHDSPIITH